VSSLRGVERSGLFFQDNGVGRQSQAQLNPAGILLGSDTTRGTLRIQPAQLAANLFDLLAIYHAQPSNDFVHVGVFVGATTVQVDIEDRLTFTNELSYAWDLHT
jgi:hypothetical protein